jgi:hypothetical protein
MPEKPLSLEKMKSALHRLDTLLAGAPCRLIVGGGGAMLLAHRFPLATTDIDAIPVGLTIADLDPHIKQIAKEQGLPGDWLNPYFSTYAHTLPQDYGSRLIEVLKGKNLTVQCLGPEEMLIMKCFAHREKDVGHGLALIKNGADVKFVETHIESLATKKVRGVEEALDFLDNLSEQL